MPDNSFAIRRILVALDASPHSLAALEMAADLAAAMNAELAGLFVEDIELLRMAESPSAREIGYAAAREAPLNRTIMERKLRAQSEQIRKTLAAAAHRAHVHWSFQTVRGQVTSELRAAAAGNDILAVGRLGWSFGRGLRIGSTARELAASSIPLLLISQPPARGDLRLLVCYNGSHACQTALLVTAELAKSGAKGITVLLGKADFDRQLAEIQDLLRGRDLEVRYREIDFDEKTNLLRVLNEERAGMLVLAGRQLLKGCEAFETLLREIEAPLLLLGNGFGREEEKSSQQAVV